MPQVTTRAEIYQSNGNEFDLYIAQPENVQALLPAILVAPAWDGLNAPIEEVTRRVAMLGYVAVGIDVYGSGIRGGFYS